MHVDLPEKYKYATRRFDSRYARTTGQARIRGHRSAVSWPHTSGGQMRFIGNEAAFSHQPRSIADS